jgi:hypothetical protein
MISPCIFFSATQTCQQFLIQMEALYLMFCQNCHPSKYAQRKKKNQILKTQFWRDKKKFTLHVFYREINKWFSHEKKMKHWYWPALLYHSSNLTEPSILQTSKPLFSKILIHFIGHFSPLTKNSNMISWYSVVHPNKLCIWTKYDCEWFQKFQIMVHHQD